LRSHIDPSVNLTAANTVAARYGTGVALDWWAVGTTLAVGYFFCLLRLTRERVGTDRVENHITGSYQAM
jgi:hypothetical protein